VRVTSDDDLMRIALDIARRERLAEIRASVVTFAATMTAATLGTLIGVVVAWWWRGVLPWQ